MNSNDTKIAIVFSGAMGSSVFLLVLFYVCKKCRNTNQRIEDALILTPLPNHAIHTTHSECNTIKKDTSKASFECTICLDTIIEENPKVIILSICGHRFHKECIDSFILTDQPLHNCPNCRKNICPFTEVNF